MLNKDMKNIFKNCIQLRALDTAMFLSLSIFPSICFSEAYIDFYWLYLLLLFIVYFAIFPLLSSGYTLGGKILKMKVISITQKKLNIFDYLHRIIKGTTFSIFSKNSIHINGYGQHDYDIWMELTILPDHILLATLEKDENYILDKLFDSRFIFYKYLVPYWIISALIISLLCAAIHYTIFS